MAELLRQECEPNAHLRTIGEQLALDLPDGVQITPRQLVNEVLRRARPHYRAIWNTCSQREKLVLIQLGQEGLVNPHSHPILQELLRKRLIVQRPDFQLMNESFRQFVLGVQVPKEVMNWEHEVEGAWDALRGVLWPGLIVLVLFLVVTQRKYLQEFDPVLKALGGGGGIAALPKILDLIRKGISRGTLENKS